MRLFGPCISIWLLTYLTGCVFAQENCPTIRVDGPAGGTLIGDTMSFSATVDVPSTTKIGYRWTVSAGTIETGNEKPHVVVRTAREFSGQFITASVEITGLPPECPNKGSEDGAIAFIGDPPLLAEMGVFSGKAFHNELDGVAKDLARYPDGTLYIISYSAPGEKNSIVSRRENSIRSYLVKTHRIDEKRLVFVRGGERAKQVRIYRVPYLPRNTQKSEN